MVIGASGAPAAVAPQAWTLFMHGSYARGAREQTSLTPAVVKYR